MEAGLIRRFRMHKFSCSISHRESVKITYVESRRCELERPS